MADNTQVDIGALPPPPTGGETRRGRHAGIGLRCAQSRDDPNRSQSAVNTAGFGGDKNVLIFLPTGFGQTTIAVLVIIRSHSSTRRGVRGGAAEGGLHCADEVCWAGALWSVCGSCRTSVCDFLISRTTSGVSKEGSRGGCRRCDAGESRRLTRKAGALCEGCGKGTFGKLTLFVLDEHLFHDTRGPMLTARVMRQLWNAGASRRRIVFVRLSATLQDCESFGVVIIEPFDLLFFM